MERRAFCVGAIGIAALALLGGGVKASASESKLLRPPGGFDEQTILGACIRCDRCRSVCPQGCIGLGTLEQGWINVDTPVMNFKRGFCDFCSGDPAGPRCVRVCATGALGAEPLDYIGCAEVSEQQCVHCRKCVPACSYDALSWDETEQLPLVNEDRCNGCGACEHVCPSDSFGYYDGAAHRAIYVVPKGGLR